MDGGEGHTISSLEYSWAGQPLEGGSSLLSHQTWQLHCGSGILLSSPPPDPPPPPRTMAMFFDEKWFEKRAVTLPMRVRKRWACGRLRATVQDRRATWRGRTCRGGGEGEGVTGGPHGGAHLHRGGGESKGGFRGEVPPY